MTSAPETDAPNALDPVVTELIALGAAIASNCEPCFRYHYNEARKLGVSKRDMARAVSVAQAVKDTPAQAMLDLADRYLAEERAPARDAVTGCCGSATEESADEAIACASGEAARSSGCCS